ncbi:ester cyclase [Candidatus Protofrankia californiensis]|uniref:ester cyclase n=1 Tax=Candidatus Protofrankia californiensis TaxID=1839754 RepID=UPI001041B932|nr:ester cyclase [Candidatus Protofrankia californiensis]
MTVVTIEGRVALQRATIEEHIRQENAKEWEKVYDTFLRDERAFYDVIPMSAHYEGIRGVQDFYEALAVALPDFVITVTGEYDLPGYSWRELTVTGTHQGEFAGIAPQGHPVRFEIAALYIFSDDDPGKLVAERAYWDNDSVYRQLKGEADAPRGGVGLTDRAPIRVA